MIRTGLQAIQLLAAASFLAVVAGCSSDAVPRERTNSQAATVPQSSTEPSKPGNNYSLLERLRTKAAEPALPFEGEGWQVLFNGSTLAGWSTINFAGAGEVEIGSGLLLLNMGQPFTGVRFTNEFPVSDYEIAFDAMRVMGTDFFCGLTVPIEESHCSLILGGWGGSLVGISSINGMDASENETTRFMSFEKERWYRVRLRVTMHRIEAWVDKDKVVDVVTKDSKVSLRFGEIEACRPLGIASYVTAAAFREIRWRAVTAPADAPRKSL